MGKRLGIDFGSTKSCAFFVDEYSMPRIVGNIEGGMFTLSSVLFDATMKEFIVGQVAEQEGVLHPENLVRCIKRHLGDFKYTIEFNGKSYSSKDIAYLIIKKLISDAEFFFADEEIEGVVLSCPTCWDTARRENLISAAKSVITKFDKPLNVIDVITDVEAISIAYVNSWCCSNQKTVLIYDLGGGAFDTAVVKLDAIGEKKNIDILTYGGDPYLGGLNWDHALESYVLQEYCKRTGDNEKEFWNNEDYLCYSQKINGTKRALSSKTSAKIIASFNGHNETIEVTRDAFEAETEHLLSETIRIIDEMMRNSKLTIKNNIDEIILVGAASKMPQVRRRLQEKYSMPIILFEPEFAVAKGAAIVANDIIAT